MAAVADVDVEEKPDTVYNQGLAWGISFVLHGVVLSALALAAAVAVRSQRNLAPLAEQSTLEHALGWTLLAVASIGFTFARSWVVKTPSQSPIFVFESAKSLLPRVFDRGTAPATSWGLTILSGFAAAGGAVILVGGGRFAWTVVGALAAVVGGAVIAAGLPALTLRKGWKSNYWQYVLLAGIALGANGLLSEFDTALKGMTLPGNEQFGFSRFPIGPRSVLGNLEEAVTNWSAYRSEFELSFSEATASGTARPPTEFAATLWHTAIDSLARGPALGLLLIGLCASLIVKAGALTEKIELGGQPESKADETERLRQLKSILTVSRHAAGLLVIVNAVGNLAAFAVARYFQAREVGTDAAKPAAIWALALVRGGATAIEFAIMAGVLGACAITIGYLLREGTPERSNIAALRAHFVLVLLLVLLLRNGQSYDAIRAWQTGKGSWGLKPWVVGGTALMGLLAAFVIRYMGEVVLVQKELRDEKQGSWQPDARTRRGYGIIAAAVAGVMGLFLGAWGLVIPVVIFGALELLSWPLSAKSDTSTQPPEPNSQAKVPKDSQNQRTKILEKMPSLQIAVASAMVAASVIASRIDRGAVRWVLIVAAFLGLIHALAEIWSEPKSKDSSGAPADDGGFRGSVRRWGNLRPQVNSNKEPYVDRRALPALLGAFMLVALGAAAIRSAAGLVIYRAGGGLLMIVGLLLILLGTRMVAPTTFFAHATGSAANTNDANGSQFAKGAMAFVLGTSSRWQFEISNTYWQPWRGVAVVRAVITFVMAAYLFIWEVSSTDWLIKKAQGFGSIAVVLLFIVVATLIASAVSYLGDQTNTDGALKLLRFKRVPFYALLFLWAVVAQRVDTGGYHDIDRVGFSNDTELAETLAETDQISLDVKAEAAFNDWWQRCGERAGANQPVPMVFVAASGGGIRAAYWTASTLDGLTQSFEASDHAERCQSPFFAMSGASGGSVGLATYATHQLSGRTDDASDYLDDDYLAPTVGWTLFVDLTRSFFLWDSTGENTLDRAGVLARAFELSWTEDAAGDAGAEPPSAPETPRPGCGGWTEDTGPRDFTMGLRSAWCLGSPLLMLNGAEVNSGCRVLVSTLDNQSLFTGHPPTSANCLRPPASQHPQQVVGAVPDRIGPLGATVDIVDYLCPEQDVAMSVSSVMSARFPLVTPSGRVEPCLTEKQREDLVVQRDDVAYVVDGGYLDNSGASGLVELWAGLSAFVHNKNADPTTACIVPIFIQLDNGYDFESSGSPDRPSELLAPVTTLFSGQASREAEAKQVVAALFGSAAIPGDRQAELNTANGRELVSRWVRIVPDAHPGIQAPLGWILSPASQEDLLSQLELETEASAHLEQLWGPDLTCGDFNAATQTDTLGAADAAEPEDS